MDNANIFLFFIFPFLIWIIFGLWTTLEITRTTKIYTKYYYNYKLFDSDFSVVTVWLLWPYFAYQMFIKKEK